MNPITCVQSFQTTGLHTCRIIYVPVHSFSLFSSAFLFILKLLVACWMNLCLSFANVLVWSRCSLMHHRIHLLCQNAANEQLNGGSGSIRHFADKCCICQLFSELRPNKAIVQIHLLAELPALLSTVQKMTTSDFADYQKIITNKDF